MKDPSDAFNPMNFILLTNQFELKLFNKTIGPNKTQVGYFFSQEIFTDKKQKKQREITSATRVRFGRLGRGPQMPSLPEVDELAMMETKRLRPNVRIYSRTIKACDLSAKWKQAVCLLTIAESKEVQLDVIICTAAISFLVWGKWGGIYEMSIAA